MLLKIQLGFLCGLWEVIVQPMCDLTFTSWVTALSLRAGECQQVCRKLQSHHVPKPVVEKHGTMYCVDLIWEVYKKFTWDNCSFFGLFVVLLRKPMVFGVYACGMTFDELTVAKWKRRSFSRWQIAINVKIEWNSDNSVTYDQYTSINYLYFVYEHPPKVFLSRHIKRITPGKHSVWKGYLPCCVFSGAEVGIEASGVMLCTKNRAWNLRLTD